MAADGAAVAVEGRAEGEWGRDCKRHDVETRRSTLTQKVAAAAARVLAEWRVSKRAAREVSECLQSTSGRHERDWASAGRDKSRRWRC